MKTKRIVQYCCAALIVAGIGLNIQNSIENYGIGENSLSLIATGGTGMSGSNDCVDGSISFASCPYSSATATTATIERCGTPNAGSWLLKGWKKDRFSGGVAGFWYAWDKITCLEYVSHIFSEPVLQSDGTLKTRHFRRWICTRKHGTTSSNCTQIGTFIDEEMHIPGIC